MAHLILNIQNLRNNADAINIKSCEAEVLDVLNVRFVSRLRKMFTQCYYTYLLRVENGAPVDPGHQRHIVNLFVDFSVEGAVLQPALVEMDDTGVTRGQRCKVTAKYSCRPEACSTF